MTRYFPLLLLTLCILLLGACQQADEPVSANSSKPGAKEIPVTEPAAENPLVPGHDYHSYANADAVRIRHAVLDLKVDFEARSLRGSVVLDLERIDSNVTELILDTRDLGIEAVVTSTGESLQFKLGATDTTLGTPLVIALPDGINQLQIVYSTAPGASGLQWLTAKQTGGGQQPFLFTQSQAIHARSWIPLQDTPKVRFTYTANIHTPAQLRAVMSANNDPEAELNGSYQFEMPQAIPSYLMALAVGDLAFAAMSERTGIYAEPAILAAATPISDNHPLY